MPTIHRFKFFKSGSLGVEFFFLVSGFLMALSISKIKDLDITDLGTETSAFLWRKIKSFLPYHVIAFPVIIIIHGVYARFSVLKFLEYILFSWPNLFCLKIIGFPGNYPNDVVWYIGAMLLIMGMYYPLIRKNFTLFTKVIAPIIAVLTLGWLGYRFGSLNAPYGKTVVGFKGLIRGFGEIALGVFCFEITNRLNSLLLTNRDKKLLSVVQILLLSIILLCFQISWNKLQFFTLLIITMLVILAFSNQHCLTELCNNKVCFFLGKISLPLYLSHMGAVRIIMRFFSKYKLRLRYQLILYIFLATVLTAIVYVLGNLLKKRWDSRNKAGIK